MTKANLTILNQYSLLTSAQDFACAIRALCARVQAQGHYGVLSYRFYANPETKTARAVIDYESAQAWIGHHDIAMTWPEMRALHAVAKLDEVTFLGDMTPDIENWLAASTLTAVVRSGNSYVTGFQR